MGQEVYISEESINGLKGQVCVFVRFCVYVCDFFQTKWFYEHEITFSLMDVVMKHSFVVTGEQIATDRQLEDE